MTSAEVRQLILDCIPDHFVDHSTLWRACGSPQGQESYFFDVELGNLASDGKITRMKGNTGIMYRKSTYGFDTARMGDYANRVTAGAMNVLMDQREDLKSKLAGANEEAAQIIIALTKERDEALDKLNKTQVKYYAALNEIAALKAKKP